VSDADGRRLLIDQFLERLIGHLALDGTGEADRHSAVSHLKPGKDAALFAELMDDDVGSWWRADGSTCQVDTRCRVGHQR
jgi:hypothetical protein